jgi:hypothetical protein
MFRSARRLISAVLYTWVAACSLDPASTPVPPRAEAGAHLLARKLPRIQDRGGPFLRHPKLVTITFSNDDPELVARLEAFGSVIMHSDWWRAAVDGYCRGPVDCIGEGSAAPPVRLRQTLPTALHDTDIDALLHREAQSGRLGAIDDSTLWLVYLPGGVALSDATTRYCTGRARAFHRALEINRSRVPFAVLPRCGDEAQLTGSASHEILEATTNPFPAERGFAFLPGSAASGFTAAGLEPVDPCGLITLDSHRVTESGFVVQRAWSNRQASLGLDPCVPSRSDTPYVLLVPREPAVRIAHVGDSAVLTLDASTAAGAGTWTVSAFDLSGQQDRERYLDVALDRSTVSAGESVTLSLRSLRKPASGRAIVGLVSNLGASSTMWPLLVAMR